MQPPCDRELRVVDGERTVGVVEEELDLAEVGRPARAAAGEEDVVRLLGPQLGGAERAGGPADRVGDIRLSGAVRADDHADARLETDLDRVREGLEATQLDGAQMHRPHPKEAAGRYLRLCWSSRASGASSSACSSSAKISRIPRGSESRSSVSRCKRSSELVGRRSATGGTGYRGNVASARTPVTSRYSRSSTYVRPAAVPTRDRWSPAWQAPRARPPARPPSSSAPRPGRALRRR